MPVQLSPEYYHSHVFDQLKIKMGHQVPPNSFALINDFSASLVMGGEVVNFKWDEVHHTGFSVQLIGLRIVE